MKLANRLIFSAGLATLVALLWHFSPSAVWVDISSVGLAGFVAIVPFQIADHALNALGWRFAFGPKDAKGLPMSSLIKARMAGDGVNYLTPSGTIAGEFVRPAALGPIRPADAVNTSVVLAKLAQALAQPAFILVGLLFTVLARMDLLDGREVVMGVAGALLVVGLVSLAIFALTAHSASDQQPRWFARFGGERVVAVRGQMRHYLQRHRGRFILSTMCFILGYGWGILEVMLICHFMGVGVTADQALAIETLSNVVDSVMFFVPAKMGTQEAGKTAIFRVLGLPASQGLAFGLIRHTREFIWAAAGFAIYAFSQRRGAVPLKQARSRPA